MYTELLEEILKNDINLNVIIDKEKDSGNIINGMRDFLHKKSFIM